MIRALIILGLLLSARTMWAEEVVLGLSRDRVAITTSFDGSDILIFGAVKREEPIPDTASLEVVITVSGPSAPIMVRRKERVAGIWMNTQAVEVDLAPSFYAVATTAPLGEVISNTEDLRHRISIEQAIRSVGAPSSIENSEIYTQALIRIREREGLYQSLEGGVVLDQDTLFRSSISMPANLTEGAYVTRIFLTRAGQVVSQYETVIDVHKVGLERWLFTLSRERALIYGLMSIAIAIAAGWGAAAAFSLLRR